jgi:class 3 adenylate cyclase
MLGIVVVIDIVAFSEKPPKAQQACLVALDGWVQELLAELPERPDRPVYQNSTGDGVLMAMRADTVGTRTAETAKWALGFAARLVRQTRPGTRPTGVPPLQLRVGVHLGEYTEEVPSFGGRHCVGLAPNHASRVVTVADPGDIIVSRELRDCLARDRFGDGFADVEYKWFQPYSEGADVPVKHGREITVYQYVDHLRGRARTKVPRSILRQEALARLIRAELNRICTAVAERLGGVDAIKPRLSLFVPAADRKTLRVANAYRVAPYDRNTRTVRSRTRYTIDPPSEAQSPCGLAYVRDEPVVVVGRAASTLKEYQLKVAQARARCCATTTEHPLRLTNRQVEEFSRRAESFIAAPVRLVAKSAGGDESPLELGGAVCMDLGVGLDGVLPEELDEVARHLMMECSRYLAALLAISRGA